MNNTQLIGRMTKDVDMKYTQNGVAVATFTLAVNRPFTNKNGDREADFIRCQVWRKLAENTAQFCKKGSQVGVTGRIQTRSFEGQDGKPVFMTEVVGDQVEFLDTKTSQGKGSSSNQSSGQSNPFQGQGQPVEVDDQDLPF
ncbi:single-stranded DNA-binding protein [Lentibacillus cibarius]|uniref:Single-stranded DNA-binding protein n=1 Tax=Lentibacillus cibarius TaxID=2583219 RepID=A0A5S3QK72_9BACI|nr:single-stranded DNA-binding protein [Lentibacillus cibarius]TMN20826.1 single-stranded DNA-binding protein [Lentibacillus cibarius]